MSSIRMTKSIWIFSSLLLVFSFFLWGCGEKKKETESQSRRENRPPVVTRVDIAPGSPRAGDTLKAMVQAMDPDGDPVELHYVWEVNGTELEEEGDELTGDILRPGDEVVVRVSAHDGKHWGEPVASKPKVIGPAPVGKVHLEVVPSIAFPGQKLKVVVKGWEGELPPLKFKWKVNEEVVKEGEDYEFETQGLKRGDVIQVEGFSEEASKEPMTARSGKISLQNSPPRILSHPPEGLMASGKYRYRVRAIDPDGDPLFFRLEGDVPEGMTIDNVTGVLQWNFNSPPEEPVKVDIRVSDGHGGEAQQTYELIFSRPGS